MPTVHDVHGVTWSVYRRWWPFRIQPLRGPTMSGDTMYGIVELVLVLPFLLVWPFWLATRLLGGPWTVVVGRSGRLIRSERVAGWQASTRRIDDLVAIVRSGGVSLLGDVGRPG